MQLQTAILLISCAEKVGGTLEEIAFFYLFEIIFLVFNTGKIVQCLRIFLTLNSKLLQ